MLVTHTEEETLAGVSVGGRKRERERWRKNENDLGFLSMSLNKHALQVIAVEGCHAMGAVDLRFWKISLQRTD